MNNHSRLESIDLEKELNQALVRSFQKNNAPAHLIESIEYSLLAPGKRIRPRLLLTSAKMLGLSLQTALPAALALEMAHCFTLIHDDLPCMDNDDFRRGKPSNHKQFGESLALLAGDSLMALAIGVFLECFSDRVVPHPFKAALSRLVWAIQGVIGGQASESLLNPQSSLKDLLQVHSQKTGALFSAAILIPKDLMGISDESEAGKALISFASELGLAFQIADDLEDAEAQPKPTSILFFVPANKIAQETRFRLNTATGRLLTHWGDQAIPLKSISDEIIQKLKP